MKSNTEKKEVQVYFYALPRNTHFVWQSAKYKKLTDDDGNLNVKELSTGKKWTFEGHYGCIISKQKANKLGIKKKDFRHL